MRAHGLDGIDAASIKSLAAVSGLSRSALTDRFETMLGVSPMRYVREWRLCLAGVALSTTRPPIAAVAQDAGYGTEAAFSRAFSRANGVPPTAWRALAQVDASPGVARSWANAVRRTGHRKGRDRFSLPSWDLRNVR
jgi:AraC-like DNA-binding protein